jgi:hypothetical protein
MNGTWGRSGETEEPQGFACIGAKLGRKGRELGKIPATKESQQRLTSTMIQNCTLTV